MLAEVQQAPSLEAACRALVDLANERGGEDNITVVLARVDGEGLSVPRDQESLTQTFQVLAEYKAAGLGLEEEPEPEEPSPAPPPARAPQPNRRGAAAQGFELADDPARGRDGDRGGADPGVPDAAVRLWTKGPSTRRPLLRRAGDLDRCPLTPNPFPPPRGEGEPEEKEKGRLRALARAGLIETFRARPPFPPLRGEGAGG